MVQYFPLAYHFRKRKHNCDVNDIVREAMSRRILLADDDAGITEAVKMMLEDEGYDVD